MQKKDISYASNEGSDQTAQMAQSDLSLRCPPTELLKKKTSVLMIDKYMSKVFTEMFLKGERNLKGIVL